VLNALATSPPTIAFTSRASDWYSSLRPEKAFVAVDRDLALQPAHLS
jgi:hypothetical protein